MRLAEWTSYLFLRHGNIGTPGYGYYGWLPPGFGYRYPLTTCLQRVLCFIAVLQRLFCSLVSLLALPPFAVISLRGCPAIIYTWVRVSTQSYSCTTSATYKPHANVCITYRYRRLMMYYCRDCNSYTLKPSKIHALSTRTLLLSTLLPLGTLTQSRRDPTRI